MVSRMIYYQPRGRAPYPVTIDAYDPVTGAFLVSSKTETFHCKRRDLRADGGQTEINDRIAALMNEDRVYG